MKRLLSSLLCLACAGPLAAHPHIFIDTGLTLRFDDDGRLSQVEVVWAYDEFYSLLITEDRGLDPDFDGVLTEAEVQDLTGFDMNWSEGFNGDLVIEQDGKSLTLSGPKAPTAAFENGRIITTHVRDVVPLDGVDKPLHVRPYDATYYSAYDVTLPVKIEGTTACGHRIEMPDIDARLRELREVLLTLDTDVTPEEAGIPDIGGLMATTVIVTCDMS